MPNDSQGVVSPRLNSRLFCAFPWQSTIVMSPDFQEISDSFIQDFLRHMLHFEKELATASQPPLLSIRHFSGFEYRTSSNQDSFKISSLSSKEIEKLFSLMAGYRLIDVFHMAANDLSTMDAPLHRRQPFIGDPTMLRSKGWVYLNDWVQLLSTFSTGMRSWGGRIPEGYSSAHVQTNKHLKMASFLLANSNTSKMLLNVHLVAMHIAHLFKSPSASELSVGFNIDEATFLTHLSTGILEPNEQKQIDSLIGISHSQITLPLHLSLAISPLFLLTPQSIFKKRWNRQSLFLIAKALGNKKPLELVAVEQRLWQGIFRIAQDHSDVVTEMQAFAGWLAPREAVLVHSLSRDWFKPEPNILNTSRTIVSTDIKHFLLADIEGTFPQSWARPERLTLPTLTSSSQPLLEHTVPGIQTDLSDLPSMNTRRLPTSPLSSLPSSPRQSEPPRTPSDPDIDIAAGPIDDDVRMASPVGSNGPRGSEDEPSNHEQDVDPGFRSKLRSKKKTQSPSNSPKSSKPVDMSIGLGLYATKNTASKSSRRSAFDGLTADRAIDVDSIFAENDVTLKVDEEILKVIGHRSIVAYGSSPSSKLTFLVEMHTKEDVDWLHGFYDAIIKEYAPDPVTGLNLPLHLADPSDSAFRVLTNDEYLQMSTADILDIFSRQNIVITGITAEKRSFDADTLETLTTMDTVVSIQDQSVAQDSSHSYNNRVCQGTLQQLLDSALQNDGEGGKILNALQFPMPEEGLGHHRFSTDSVAWRATKGRRGSSDGESPPLADIRWGLAATKGAVHWWHIDSDGFGTFIDVIAGYKWWFVAKEKDSGLSFGHTTLFLGDYQLEEPNNKLWSVEAILLEAGSRLLMRPNTPHVVFSPVHAICHGGHFYSTGNMQRTFFGIVHAFIGGQLLTNTEHSQSRGLLRRMGQFYYDGLVLLNFNASSRPHLPDLSSIDSLLEVLSLCNILVLSNVLDERTYYGDDVSSDSKSISLVERYHITYSRGLALHLLDSLDSLYLLHELNQSGNKFISLKAFAAFFLAQQSATVLHYKEFAEVNGLDGAVYCTPDLLRDQIDECLKTWPACHEAFRDIDEASDSMAWTSSSTYRLLPRPTIRTQGLDYLDLVKRGSTSYDRDYFELLSRSGQERYSQKRKRLD